MSFFIPPGPISSLLPSALSPRTLAHRDINRPLALWLKVGSASGETGRRLKEDSVLREYIALAAVADRLSEPEVSRFGQGPRHMALAVSEV